MNKHIKYILFLLILGVFLVAGSEVGLRFLGYKPDVQAVKPEVQLVTGGTFFMADTTIGYTNRPGRHILLFPHNYQCICTHDSSGFRITRPVGTDSLYRDKMEIWILGCSNTYGWSLNDWETYPYRLQQMNPDVNIINFSVSGFGDVQSLLQLQQALQTKSPPRIVILAYAAMHERRNIMSASRRKIATVYNYLGPLVQPYADLTKEDSLIIYRPIKIEYNRVPLSQHSALVHFIERAVNSILLRLSNSEDVSLAIIKEMNRLCIEHDIHFIVAGIAHDKRTFWMLDQCRELNIPVVDISLSNHSGVFSNDPYDGHPNAIANAYYASKLNQFLHGSHLIPE